LPEEIAVSIVAQMIAIRRGQPAGIFPPVSNLMAVSAEARSVVE
jgi:xanthine/CO dehydrogenase XdhC/CoxF family maturation factor